MQATPSLRPSSSNHILTAGVIVAALGYFVDVFDLVLFSIVRVASLEAIGLRGQELLTEGVFLLNTQMIGMLIGGVIWGVWGDKRGRISVLFGSIFLYSVATLLNAYATNLTQYALCRFFAGLGLAGELGGGITLVAESLPKDKRGLGTTIVAGIGVAGALFAAVIGEAFSWQNAYIIGGSLGLVLLLSRFVVHESGMFHALSRTTARKGDLWLLLSSPPRFFRFLNCILVGLPIWYVVAIFYTFAPEIGAALHMAELPIAGKAVFWGYTGFILGDFGSGLLSQYLRTRTGVIRIFIIGTLMMATLILTADGATTSLYYLLCALLGLGGGYWAVFVTTAAEQFGTNLRATVTTTVPNFIRGSVVPITFAFNLLIEEMGILGSAAMVGVVCTAIALFSLSRLSDSFHRDLDYLEE